MPMTPSRRVRVRGAKVAIKRLGDGLYAGPKWCSLKKMPSKPHPSAFCHRSRYQL